jgi:hypothetical protein
MKTKPEEIVGKWISNLRGEPRNYQFILNAKSHVAADVEISYIQLKPSGKIQIIECGLYNYKTIGGPIKSGIDLDFVNKKLVGAIFRHF